MGYTCTSQWFFSKYQIIKLKVLKEFCCVVAKIIVYEMYVMRISFQHFSMPPLRAQMQLQHAICITVFRGLV